MSSSTHRRLSMTARRSASSRTGGPLHRRISRSGTRPTTNTSPHALAWRSALAWPKCARSKHPSMYTRTGRRRERRRFAWRSSIAAVASGYAYASAPASAGTAVATSATVLHSLRDDIVASHVRPRPSVCARAEGRNPSSRFRDRSSLDASSVTLHSFPHPASPLRRTRLSPPGVRNNTLFTSSIGMSRMVGTDPCAREEGESAVGGRREENGKETSKVPTPGKTASGSGGHRRDGRKRVPSDLESLTALESSHQSPR